MSTKILVFTLVVLHLSLTEAAIDCRGKSFLCATQNTYLVCTYDATLNAFVTEADRSEPCRTGVFCDENSDIRCDAGLDCGGKEFLCQSTDSYIRCAVHSDWTYRTTSTEVQFCPDGSFCDQRSDGECQFPVTTEAPTDPPTTEATTTTVAPLSGYTCPNKDRQPHPIDCRRYILCHDDGRYAELDCPSNYVNNPELGACTPDTTPCDNYDFKCEATGRFADPVNPSKYMWCLKVNGVFQKLKYSCPVGTVYNGVNACFKPTLPLESKT